MGFVAFRELSNKRVAEMLSKSGGRNHRLNVARAENGSSQALIS